MGVREYARIVSEDFTLDPNEWIKELKSYKFVTTVFTSDESRFDSFVWLDDNIGEDEYFDQIIREGDESVTYIFFTYYQDMIQFKLARL
jgi:hypothetical protein